LVREAGELAKLVKLRMTYDVEWIRYGEAVSNMFISDMKFLNMEHINAKYSINHAVEKEEIFLQRSVVGVQDLQP
jgi:hypothetical protein